MDILLTGMIFFVLVFLYLTGITSNECVQLMRKESLKPIKFLFAIIIIFVHIPQLYGNRLQDMIGSFAFIGVSFFDLSSAYGLKYLSEHKHSYLDTFWKKRIFEIVIPLFCIAILYALYEVVFRSGEILFIKYKNIYGWILVLFEFYILFWVIYRLSNKYKWLYKYKDYLICVITFILSVTDFFFNINIIKGWSLERLGFIMGILLYNKKDKIEDWAGKKTFKKIVVLLVSSIFAGIVYLITKNMYLISYFTKAILEFIFLFLIVLWTSKYSTSNCMMLSGGGISYGLYISHPFLFLLLTSWSSTNAGWMRNLFIPLVVIGSIFIACCITKIMSILRKGINI